MATARVGNNIVGGDHPQQWKLVEEHSNSYVCVYIRDYDLFFILINNLDVNVGFAPLSKNGHVYWHLADGESGTAICNSIYSDRLLWNVTLRRTRFDGTSAKLKMLKGLVPSAEAKREECAEMMMH